MNYVFYGSTNNFNSIVSTIIVDIPWAHTKIVQHTKHVLCGMAGFNLSWNEIAFQKVLFILIVHRASIYCR